MAEDVQAAGPGARPLLIDVHSHPSSPRYQRMLAEIAAFGPEKRFAYKTFFPPKFPDWTPEFALEMMEREGIGAQVLSLPDATVELRGEAARGIARAVNESMAEIVAKHPRRFAALGVVPHDDLDSTLAETAYALDILKLDGLATTTNVRGTYLGDSSFDPWLEELHRRKAVLLVHPTASAAAIPQSPTFIEFCFDSTRMVVNMVLSGAIHRFSGIHLISTHGGGTAPFVSHRLEEFAPLLLRNGRTSDEIGRDLRSFFYDLTSCLSEVPLAAASRFVDPSRLLLGFDFPYAPPVTIGPAAQRFFAFGGLSSIEKTSVASRNALALFARLASA